MASIYVEKWRSPSHLSLSSRRTILFLAAAFTTLGIVQADVRYIDDELGDSITDAKPVYLPTNGWALGQICGGCGFHPNVSRAFNGTWHDTTHHTDDPPRSVEFNFTGISLDVFCIVPNPSDPTLTSAYNLTFLLDNEPLEQTFTHTSDKSDQYSYNVSVLSIDNLTQSPHAFTMWAASTEDTIILFDYARYTTETTPRASFPSSSSSPSPGETSSFSTDEQSQTLISQNPPNQTPNSKSSGSPTNQTQGASESRNLPAILGSTLSGIALVLLVVAVLMYRRHRHRLQNRIPENIEPFYSTPRETGMRNEETEKVPPSSTGYGYGVGEAPKKVGYESKNDEHAVATR